MIDLSNDDEGEGSRFPERYCSRCGLIERVMHMRWSPANDYTEPTELWYSCIPCLEADPYNEIMVYWRDAKLPA